MAKQFGHSYGEPQEDTGGSDAIGKIKLIGALIGILAIIVIIVGVSGLKVIQPGERGIKITMGKLSDDTLGEGWHLTWPSPVTRVLVFDTRQVKRDLQQVCYSSDTQSVTIDMSVIYHINEAKLVDLYRAWKVATPESVFDTLVVKQMQEAVERATTKQTAESTIRQRDILHREVMPYLRETISNMVTIDSIVFSNTELTKKLEAAIEEKQVKQQEALAKQYELDKAKKDAEIVEAKARGEASAIEMRAIVLQKYPSVILLELIQKWDGEAPSYLGLGSSNLSTLLPGVK